MIANDTNHAANERTFLAWIRAGLAAGAVVPLSRTGNGSDWNRHRRMRQFRL